MFRSSSSSLSLAPPSPRARSSRRRSRPSPLRLAAVLALCAPACRNTPPEPSTASTNAGRGGAAQGDPNALYRPDVQESARRIVAASADASDNAGMGSVPPPGSTGPATVARAVRLDLPLCPAAVDVVAVLTRGRWVVAAVERDRVTVGLAGAERIYTLLNEAHRAATAADMARIVGSLYYYPWPVFDGATWSRTGEGSPVGQVASPQLIPRLGGTGRGLVFAFWIPDGTMGAGMHLGNFRVTDSGLLIDEAPRPDRR